MTNGSDSSLHSCESETAACLTRIHERADLNAFITVFAERALEKARCVDRRLAEGQAGRLAGWTVGVKDLFLIRGTKVTAGSRLLEPLIGPYTATVVHRLEEEDAVILGKTNLDEFGMGSSSEHSAFGPVHHPQNALLTPGGSSGGSAAAVAAGLCRVALGSDTGGSVRQPAAFCGLVGLRPTYGRISRYGLIPFASSLDTVGLLTRNIPDCARLLSVLAGYDSQDATSLPDPVPDYVEALPLGIKGLRFGFMKEAIGEDLQPDIRGAIDRLRCVLKGNGAEVAEISLPISRYGVAAYYLICMAEAASNLARYGGCHYGLRVGGDSLKTMVEATRHQGFGDEVKRRILLGNYVLSAGYYEAYYKKAQQVRTLIRRDFERVFQICDVIVEPTTPTTAFRLGEKREDPLTMYLSDVFTVNAPLAGLPALSVPVGRDTEGRPIGIQLTARPLHEADLLRAGHWIMETLG